MQHSSASTFLRRVHQASAEWTQDALVCQLLGDGLLGLSALASQGLLTAGVLVPIDLARLRLAQRIAFAVLRDAELPLDVDGWIRGVAEASAHSLRVDGLSELMSDDRDRFLARFAAALGIEASRAADAWVALHTLDSAHVAAFRACLSTSWGAVALVGCSAPGDARIATQVVRHVITALRTRPDGSC